MPDLVAEYGCAFLPVVDVMNGVPLVWFKGEPRPADEVRLHGHGLDGIRLAPTTTTAPPGMVADFETSDEGGDSVIESLSVVAFRFGRADCNADAWVAQHDSPSLDLVSELDGSGFEFLGYRLAEPE